MRRAWPNKRIADVCQVNPREGKVGLPPAESEVSFVPMSAIDEVAGAIHAAEVRRCGDVSKGYTYFRENDILFAKITPCMQNGKVAIARKLLGGFGFGSTEFHVLRPGPEVLPEWIFAYVRQPSFKAAAEANFTGTAGQQRVPISFMSGSQIPVPPIPEQKRIVAILDAAEELRRLREQTDQRTDDLLPALFHEMFGDPATNPKGWPELSLKEICDVKGGKRLPKGDEYANEPTPFRYIRVSDFSGGMIDESRLLYLKADTQYQISRYTVGGGDIIISIAGTIGLTAVVPLTLSGANLTENAAKLVAKSVGVYDPVFLCETLRTPHAQSQIGSHTGQVTIGKLALFRIEKLRIILPPLHLQRDFAARVAAIRAMETSQAASRRRLDDLFQSFLHRAFREEL